MILFYLFAFIPIIIGLVLWLKSKTILWQEWLIGCGAAFMVSMVMHMIAVIGMTDDIETWSGRITLAKQFSAWREYYEEAIYRTEYYTETESYYDSDGNRHTRTVQKSRRVFDHWEPRKRWHDEYFRMYSDIDTTYSIDKNEYLYLVSVFSNQMSVLGDRTTFEHNSKMIDGDRYDYESRPVSGYVYPVTRLMHFENRIKAAPTVFSFMKVPSNIPVFNWPENPNFRKSDRLVGDAKNKINILKWDQMNAVLGPIKQVNVIMVGFTNQSSIMFDYQQAKWIGGKKNDIVLCYGENSLGMEDWVRVFSWSEREDCKRNLESILLENPIDDNIIPLIQKEILTNFERKDWHKFDYISIDPPTWAFPVYFMLMILTQVGLYIFFHKNEFKREDNQDVFNRPVS